MTEWKDVSTAPNGELILFFPGKKGRNAQSPMIRVDFYPVRYPRQPTHWMPLPPPPPSED